VLDAGIHTHLDHYPNLAHDKYSWKHNECCHSLTKAINKQTEP